MLGPTLGQEMGIWHSGTLGSCSELLEKGGTGKAGILHYLVQESEEERWGMMWYEAKGCCEAVEAIRKFTKA